MLPESMSQRALGLTYVDTTGTAGTGNSVDHTRGFACVPELKVKFVTRCGDERRLGCVCTCTAVLFKAGECAGVWIRVPAVIKTGVDQELSQITRLSKGCYWNVRKNGISFWVGN